MPPWIKKEVKVEKAGGCIEKAGGQVIILK